MTQREKILGYSVASVVGVFAIYFGAKVLFMKPLQDLSKKTISLRDSLDKINSERKGYFSDEDKLKGAAKKTFSDDIDQATAKCGEVLAKQVLAAGLRESDFSRSPTAPRKLRGATEIGWSLQGEGPLDKVVNLLFLAEKSPYLHRVDDLVLFPGQSPGLVRVRFRYLTLVIQPAPAVDLKELPAPFNLAAMERRVFDVIAARDILRPFIPRAAPGPTTAPPSGTPPGPEVFRVVSLSEWMGKPEVHVLDSARQKTARYQPGDELAGGTIAMVDYRPMPARGHEGLKSFSRVIVKIGSDYWAIDRGQTLAEKYKLSTEQLPEKLAAISK